MKLSTRIKMYAPICNGGDICTKKIVLLVGGGDAGTEKRLETYSLEMADNYHNELLRQGCTLLPSTENPVINSRAEIVWHYTATTYWYWCHELMKYAAPMCYLMKRDDGSETVAATAMFGQGIRYWLHADEPEVVVWWNHYGARRTFCTDNATAKQRNIYRMLKSQLDSDIAKWTANGTI